MVLFGCGFLAAQTAWTTAFMSAMPDAVVGASAGVTKATMATGSALASIVLSTLVVLVGQADLIQRHGPGLEPTAACRRGPGTVGGGVRRRCLAHRAAARTRSCIRGGLLGCLYRGFSAALLAGAALCLGAA